MMGKPILPFVLDNNFPWPPAQIDVDNRRIEAFRELLMQDRIVSIFTTPNDLSVKVGTAISQYSRQVEGISLGPPEPEAPSEEVTLANVVEELKGMRTDVSVLQQSVLELTRRPYSDSANYGSESFLSPADFLGVAASIMNPQRCFVIMPYSEQWSGAVERILLEICSEVGLEFSIAKNMEGRFIPNDIWRGITGAGIIVADLSGANPNVTYEVGLADVIGRDVILIGQEAKVPFDFLGQRLILYQDSLSGTLALREELTDRLKRYKLNLTSGDDSITN